MLLWCFCHSSPNAIALLGTTNPTEGIHSIAHEKRFVNMHKQNSPPPEFLLNFHKKRSGFLDIFYKGFLGDLSRPFGWSYKRRCVGVLSSTENNHQDKSLAGFRYGADTSAKEKREQE